VSNVEPRVAPRKAFERGFRASSDAITISRLEDGVIIEANDSFCTLIGYDRSEVIGRTASDLGIYADATARSRMLRRVLYRGGVSDHEVEVRRRDGARVHASVSADLISDNGEVQLFAIGRDVTPRRIREQGLLGRLHEVRSATCCEDDHLLVDLTSDVDDEAAPAG
jgi:PAS domain S-box-containing protein